jgi:hypothetical protein
MSQTAEAFLLEDPVYSCSNLASLRNLRHDYAVRLLNLTILVRAINGHPTVETIALLSLWSPKGDYLRLGI